MRGIVGPTRGVVSTEALRWNGRSWHLQHIPTLPGANLNAVSCVSETDCVAVGASNAGTLAERWNGEDWTIQATPNPAGKAVAGFTGVSCTSASFCVAVGGPFDSAGNPVATLAERWNGKRWAIQPTPSTGSPGTLFNTVACTSALSCTAAGALADSSGNAFFGTLAERWNGTNWNIQPTPVLPGLGLVDNFTAACPSQSTCIAAGGFENDGPGAKTLTEVWRGGASAAQPAPGAFSPRAYRGIAGCIRAAESEGFAMGATATRTGPKIKGSTPHRSQPTAEIEQITSLCGAA